MSDSGGLDTGASAGGAVAGAGGAGAADLALDVEEDGGLEDDPAGAGAGTVGAVGTLGLPVLPLDLTGFALLGPAPAPEPELEATCWGRRGGEGEADERGDEARDDIFRCHLLRSRVFVG
jgi:hypothetical protein